ncbi:MAG TPA: hypothetical protein VEE84_08385 [Burkholderiaceae bacterium]|nr:hypothetical protein [Burkholderiaceae bacterium]
MRSSSPICLAAAFLALFPVFASGAGSMQPKPNKDFRELIVKGERPEIAACLAASIDYVRHNPVFAAIRWSEEQSDRAIMSETESNGHLVRMIHMTAQLRVPGSTFFSEPWRPMELYCEQPEDGSIRVFVKPIAR